MPLTPASYSLAAPSQPDVVGPEKWKPLGLLSSSNVLHPHAIPCFSTSCFQNLVLLGKQVTRLPESPQVPRPISLSLLSPSLGIDWTLIVLWKHCFSADHWVTLSSIPRFPQGRGWLSILLTSYCLSLAIALHPGVKIPFPLVIIVTCCLSNLLILCLLIPLSHTAASDLF